MTDRDRLRALEARLLDLAERPTPEQARIGELVAVLRTELDGLSDELETMRGQLLKDREQMQRVQEEMRVQERIRELKHTADAETIRGRWQFRIAVATASVAMLAYIVDHAERLWDGVRYLVRALWRHQ